MKTQHLAAGQQSEGRLKQSPIEYDSDWEYTGEVFQCIECGHAFTQPPYDFEVCPECGADLWPGEDS